MQNIVLILDFGSPYTQLIARDIRELQIYCEIHPYYNIPQDLSAYTTIVLSRSSAHLLDKKAPRIEWSKLIGNIPLLTMGYTAQLLIQEYEGSLSEVLLNENQTQTMRILTSDTLVDNCDKETQVWMTSGLSIKKLPENFVALAEIEGQISLFKLKETPVYGMQFYPQVYYTTQGKTM